MYAEQAKHCEKATIISSYVTDNNTYVAGNLTLICNKKKQTFLNKQKHWNM